MSAAAKSREHHVSCLEPIADVSGDEQLQFEIDGQLKGVSLKITSLTKSLVSALPTHVIDLIEIASFVYAIDASISRGGLRDQAMGAKWHRRFLVTMPVRALSLWNRTEIKQELEETVMFLSGDRFEFIFTQLKDKPLNRERYFDFGDEGSWVPDTVMLFSGGLDSFAGALEEIVERENKVALISHFSSTKIKPIQDSLQKAMAQKLGSQKLKHFQTKVQLKAGTNKEGTHRTRSFLFASLAAAIAAAFDQDRISFYENGIVSLNLPPVGNVLGTRATRTTHPQTLTRFSSLFSRIFGTPLRVDNPFFWRTKKEVVEKIFHLGMADQIAHTRSCADVHNQTRQHVHCGRCSQCIDRRFAIMAAGLQKHDPEEAYRVDLMTGTRTSVQDKEVALSYVRNALGYDVMSPHQLERHFPEVLSAIKYLDESPDVALMRLSDLLKRHGAGVIKIMKDIKSTSHPDDFPSDSLPSMFGELQQEQVTILFGIASSENVKIMPLEPLQLVFDGKRKTLTINEMVELRGAAYQLLSVLAEKHLEAAGQGLNLLDYPAIPALSLRKKLGLSSEEAVRQNVKRARNRLAKKFLSAGLNSEHGKILVENLPWHGYRLNPEQTRVFMRSKV
ncbi:7-cyano-7-deazaguanine synthase [Sneathiella sp. HT1-7]|uniref:7-cyano-7-deazaguanine synthase n=1 Tax=Sneathiella sp. HT1-7 TaxID=2887192 RepID=UPI001D139DAF|nr:7-cyano-7-deazaguanine synthase [Sneathiella sp. HT1-7]MCC3306223.1 7-cyano-7-deazaguanine synthase [Sneathiella sp. HT1-7]